MLNDEELEQLIGSRQLSDEARQMIRHIRRSEPSRRVESRKKNVACRFPSRKMGVVIQAESHTNELAAVYLWEHDPNVFEFYDQPPAIPLCYAAVSGKVIGVQHTPDYFVIGEKFIGWVECKTGESLHKLAQTQPNRFVLNADGTWRCPPGEAFAAKYGLSYAIRSSNENDWVLIRNLIFLQDYLDPSVPKPSPEAREIISNLFREKPWIKLIELVRVDPQLSGDTIYKMIVDGDLYFDFRKSLLPDIEVARVYRDRVSAEAFEAASETSGDTWHSLVLPVTVDAGANVMWDGKLWHIFNVGDDNIHLSGPDGNYAQIRKEQFDQLVAAGTITGLPNNVLPDVRREVERILSEASPTDMSEALVRYRTLFPDPEAPNKASRCRRSAMYYRKAFREAERTLGCGFIGLVPRVSRRGNRACRLDKSVLDNISKVVDEKFADARKAKKSAIYGELRLLCKESGLVVPSEKAFRRQLARLHTIQVERRRLGDKAAYDREEFYWRLELGTPRHGDRPFDIAHIDHTELDLTLWGLKNIEEYRRPWLSMMIDAYTRMILAFVLTFEKPSYVACMLLIQDCVRRHGRVPRVLVMDGGAEFGSTYFETLMARLEITKKTRPPSKGRFGSVMERLFGLTNDEFIHNLAGNTQALRNPRQCSSTHDPRRLTVWTLESLTERFEEWVNNVYAKRLHSAHGVSPEQAFAIGMADLGMRPHKRIPYTQDFQTSCLPAAPRGKIAIDSAKGVKIKGVRYWCPEFRDPVNHGHRVDARYHPLDVSRAYVYLNGHWLLCQSEYASIFHNRSWKEIAFASREIVARHQLAGKRSRFNAETVALFLRSTNADEVELARQKAHLEAHINDEAASNTDNPLPDMWDSPWNNAQQVTQFGDFK